jgi:hypothetical protein
VGEQVTAQDVLVKLDRLRPKAGPLVDQVRRVLAERHLAIVRVDPVVFAYLGFLEGEPDLSA